MIPAIATMATRIMISGSKLYSEIAELETFFIAFPEEPLASKPNEVGNSADMNIAAIANPIIAAISPTTTCRIARLCLKPKFLASLVMSVILYHLP